MAYNASISMQELFEKFTQEDYNPTPIELPEDTREYANFSTSYMEGVENVRGMADKLRRLRSRKTNTVEFDTLVGTGVSGTVPLMSLANSLHVNWLTVRKPTDRSHNGNQLLSGKLGKRWIFLDDFISSGETLRRVYFEIEKELYQSGGRGKDYYGRQFHTEFVGAFLYRDRFNPFFSAADLTIRYRLLRDKNEDPWS